MQMTPLGETYSCVPPTPSVSLILPTFFSNFPSCVWRSEADEPTTLHSMVICRLSYWRLAGSAPSVSALEAQFTFRGGDGYCAFIARNLVPSLMSRVTFAAS